MARAQATTTFQWLRQLWINAGGNPGDADTMAAIAMAESSGRLTAHAYTDREDSRGLWQVNVYAHPNYEQVDLYNPQVNARAAVAIRRGGLQNWSTYTNGAYLAYLPGGSSSAASGSIRERPISSTGVKAAGVFGGLGGIESAAQSAWHDIVGVIEGPITLIKAALWLTRPQSWLRMVEFVTGAFLMFLGIIGLATLLAGRNDTTRAAAGIASSLPGPIGVAGRAVTIAGSTQGRKAAASRAVPARLKERGAEQQGRRDEQAREEGIRLRKARERGRQGTRRAAGERAFRVEHPDFDEIPF